jgi:hypothetical protein
MNTKTTATEWLFEKLWDSPKDKFTWNAILEQANKMFEQQQYDFYMKGNFEGRGNYEEPTNKDDFELAYKKEYDK